MPDETAAASVASLDTSSNASETDMKVTRYSECRLPTEYGEFSLIAYNHEGAEHLAIVSGDVHGRESVWVRMHSECLTGEVLHSLRCDCRQQLELSLKRIAEHGGVVIYLRQEGRGIGLGNKIRAYALQDEGHDTVDANRELGFPDDARDYAMVPAILSDLGVRSVVLMTNNPDKLNALKTHGVQVVRREPHVVTPTDHNHAYLNTKRVRMGHLLD